MIGISLQHDSRARSNTERLLALFLGFALCIHGLYYPQEWYLFGFVLSVVIMAVHLSKGFHSSRNLYSPIGMTDGLLLGMLLVSLAGILNPVRLTDGFLEALKWGIFWVFYRWGVSISFHERAKSISLRYIQWLAVIVAVIGWLPWVSKVAGRLSSVFGYPNATAVFLGTILLLSPSNTIIKIFLGISLLGTGSRAGVGFFIMVFAGQYALLEVNEQRILSRHSLIYRQRLGRLLISKYLKRFLGFVMGIIGSFILFFHYPSAWDNLTEWGFASSSWQERLVYFKDGLKLAWESWGLPEAGGWQAFPTVQSYPYWTADPHSSIIHIVLNQGIAGIIAIGIWIGHSLLEERKVWGSQGYLKTHEERQARLRLNSALLYLALHSFVDADFSFGSLGILFWLLYGTMDRGPKHKSEKPFYRKSQLYRDKLVFAGVFGLGAFIGLLCGYIFLNPKFLEREQVWNIQASQRAKVNPDNSEKLWQRSLQWDQTQVRTKRELAEHLLQKGDLDSGMDVAMEVLRWQAFDLEAYEWAQSVILEAAEENREKNPPKAKVLYRWVEKVPEVIEKRTANLTKLQQKLWPGHIDFLPTQHIQLLAEYARQRQLTQRLP